MSVRRACALLDAGLLRVIAYIFVVSLFGAGGAFEAHLYGLTVSAGVACVLSFLMALAAAQ